VPNGDERLYALAAKHVHFRLNRRHRSDNLEGTKGARGDKGLGILVGEADDPMSMALAVAAKATDSDHSAGVCPSHRLCWTRCMWTPPAAPKYCGDNESGIHVPGACRQLLVPAHPSTRAKMMAMQIPAASQWGRMAMLLVVSRGRW
jgi:hypothetical protein